MKRPSTFSATNRAPTAVADTMSYVGVWVMGAENWAILASLIETCKLGGIDPQAYVADVLTRLVNLWPNDRLDELMPWAWAAARQPMQRAA